MISCEGQHSALNVEKEGVSFLCKFKEYHSQGTKEYEYWICSNMKLRSKLSGVDITKTMINNTLSNDKNNCIAVDTTLHI